MQNFCATLTAFLWSAMLVVPSLTGHAQTTNQVLSLDGSGGYVTVPSAPDLQNPTEITVEAWIYPNDMATPNQCFIGKSDGGNIYTSRSYEMDWTPNGGNTGPGSRVEFSFFLGANNWALLGVPVVGNRWIHVAAIYRSSDGLHQLYTNGVLAASSTTDADLVTPLAGKPLRQTTLPVRFGRGDYSPYFYARGDMDEVRIWNKARTQAEIAGSRFCRLSGSEPNLAGYWNFDAGTATDLTGHGHTGTFGGNAQAVPIVGSDAVHAGECGTTVSIRVSQVELCWDTLTNNWYQLQYESALTTNPWVPFMTNWIAGDGNRFCTNDAVLGDQVKRFYRVAVTNAPPQ